MNFFKAKSPSSRDKEVLGDDNLTNADSGNSARSVKGHMTERN